MSRLTVIIIAGENSEHTRLMSEGIIAAEKKLKISVIIVDTGYREELSLFAEGNDDIVYVYQEEGETIGSALNSVLEYFEIDTNVFFLNGTYFDAGDALYRMQFFIDDRGCAVVSGKSNLLSGAQFADGITSYDDMCDICASTTGLSFRQAISVATDFLMCSSECIKGGNVFNTDMETFDAVIKDFLLGTIQRNGLIGITEEALFWGILTGDRSGYFDKNLLNARYGLEDIDSSYDTLIMSFIKEKTDAGFNVLEINCDCGADLVEVKNRYPMCELYGIESDVTKAEIAQRCCNLIGGSFSEQVVISDERLYKYIIIKDMSGNTEKTRGMLQQVKESLTEDGIVIYSGSRALDYVSDAFTDTGYYVNETCQNDNHKYVLVATRRHNLFLPQGLINLLSDVRYNGVGIYRYIVDHLQVFDSDDEIVRNGNFNSQKKEIMLDITKEEAGIYIGEFLKSLSERQILVFNIANTQSIRNENVLPVIDPYLDVLDQEQYCVVDMSDANICDSFENAQRHTRNLFFCHPQCIMACSGLDYIDYSALLQFMDENIFSLTDDYLRRKIYPFQREHITAIVWNALQIRRAYIEFYDKVIDIVKPKIVMYSHGANPQLCMLYEAAKKRGIPCVEIDHGVNTYRVQYPAASRHNDVLCVYSDWIESVAKEHAIDNVVAVGKPFMLSHPESKASETTDRIVVSVISSCETGILQMAERISNSLNPDKYTVLYKKHGSEEINNYDEIKRNFPNLVFISDISISKVFELSNVVIGHRSTAILEALIYDDIKIILTGLHYDYFPEGDYSHLGMLLQNQELVYAGTDADIVLEIKNYKRGKLYRKNGSVFWKKDAENEFKNFMAGYLR